MIWLKNARCLFFLRFSWIFSTICFYLLQALYNISLLFLPCTWIFLFSFFWMTEIIFLKKGTVWNLIWRNTMQFAAIYVLPMLDGFCTSFAVTMKTTKLICHSIYHFMYLCYIAKQNLTFGWITKIFCRITAIELKIENFWIIKQLYGIWLINHVHTASIYVAKILSAENYIIEFFWIL